ncbi:class I SAM-dependent methyltransferase [Aerophototrophica crusticola]|uniref:Class I SAM-dependent methyltransferase n=1 Tax=Aerophototrophica crusticola TaxID=1709002 RepID=A0A858RA62_9PROT|nr:class I SAM-dependent methyltransferase [Rhodospirillaceae bacterium B3]
MTLAPSHLPPPPAPARRRGVGDGGSPDDPGARALAAQVALLRSLCGPGRPSLLHVGCGTGQVLLGLAPDLGLGIGVAPDVEDVCRARLASVRQGLGRLHFTVGTAVAFRVDQVPPQAFDLVLVQAIGGLRGLSRDLGGALRRLAPGGRIVVLGTDDSHPAVVWRRWCRGRSRRPA